MGELADQNEDTLWNISGDPVMGGDINARLPDWGIPSTNRRDVLDMATRLLLQVANQGSMFTYTQLGFGNSIPDVTYTSERVAGLSRGWRISEELTGSDHQYILF